MQTWPIKWVFHWVPLNDKQKKVRRGVGIPKRALNFITIVPKDCQDLTWNSFDSWSGLWISSCFVSIGADVDTAKCSSGFNHSCTHFLYCLFIVGCGEAWARLIADYECKAGRNLVRSPIQRRPTQPFTLSHTCGQFTAASQTNLECGRKPEYPEGT